MNSTHPQRADCTVRALAAVAGIDYGHALAIAADAGRRANRRMKSRRLIDFIQSQPRLGLRFRKLRGAPRTIHRFCLEHPSGRFFCRRRNHAFAVIDGAVVGEPQGDRTLVLAAWELVQAPAQDDVQRLHQLCPISMIDAACELDTSYRRIQGLALVLMRRGLARWRRGKLVSTGEVVHGT